MLNKQTERTTGIQAENTKSKENNLRKIKGKTSKENPILLRGKTRKIGHSIGLT